MKSLEAILVDFDGTLVNTEKANAKAYTKALNNNGFSIPMELVLTACVGRHWSKFLPDLLSEDYDEKIGKIVSIEKKRIYREFYSEVTLNKPLLDILDISSKNIPIALVTSASKGSVTEILNMFCLDKFFSEKICQEDVKNPKPDPECYILAASRLNVSCQNCIAIEDSETGLLAAKNAGIQTLRVSPFTA
jgi:beta-phosphoglucomutase